jgi:hypothetical protein
MEWVEPPKLPSLSLPNAPNLPIPILEVPRADVPSYRPLVVPPNTLRPPPGIEGINSDPESEEEDSNTNTSSTTTKPNIPPEAQIIQVPFTDIEVPMPTTTIMTTAATTAFISVGATLAATSLFKYLVMLMKPIFKQAWNKLQKKKTPTKSPKTS